jgi:uncharacterized protein (DUF2141 family)
MRRQPLQILKVLVLIVLFTSCAQIAPLGGGRRDTTPPKLVEADPPNKSVNMKRYLVILKFDEFVQLKDLSNQLIITPKLKTTPEITAEGKKIKIQFVPAQLLPNTTYRLYLGSAIADMHEGVPLNDFEYIFSTGPYIDSLKLSGAVTEANNNTQAGSVLVGLYDNDLNNDSLPYKKTPDYISRTGADGKFALNNLPAKKFAVFAFTDKNKNNLYDGDAEKIAFYGSSLELRSDSAIKLNLFQEEAPKTYIKKTSMPYYGYGEVILNKKSRATFRPLNAALANDIWETNSGKEKDTLSFYYRSLSDTLSLAVQVSASKTDTVKLVVPRLNKGRRIKNIALNTPGGRLGLETKLRINFPVWMDTTYRDLSRLKLSSRSDSMIALAPGKGRWLGITAMELTAAFKEGVAYSLKMDTLAFKDYNGSTNDSARFNFTVSARTDFGKLTIKLKVNKKQSYVAQLINDQQKPVAERYISFPLSASNTISLDFPDILPGVYTFKLMYDDNENKKWDTGNLLQKKQPEKVFISSKQLKMLADWEVEEEILVKE